VNINSQIEFERLVNRQVFKYRLFLAQALILVVVFMLALFLTGELERKTLFSINAVEFTNIYMAFSTCAFILTASCICLLKFSKGRNLVAAFRDIEKRIDNSIIQGDLAILERILAGAKDIALDNYLMEGYLLVNQESIDEHLGHIRKRKRHRDLEIEIDNLNRKLPILLASAKDEIPVIKAKKKLEKTLAQLQVRRKSILADWQLAYKDFSWWNKLKYGDSPDFREMDSIIRDLERTLTKFKFQYGNKLNQVAEYFSQVESEYLIRVEQAKDNAQLFIENAGQEKGIDSHLLKKSFWLSAMSVPVSMWIDIDKAGSVYDALRGVNGNFAELTNSEIWWETMLMPPESLAGLVSLTKGAYFEQLVAADTGGQLFEHFNHENTDIVIGGIEYQIKATDSADYIDSVANGVPVIATSEVAEITGAIDSGYSNEDLQDSVDLALGGAIVDLGDTAVDAILADVGGLGFFATIAGINHAAEKYNNGGDGLESMLEGAGVAVEGTARSLVGTAELGYKALTSRPSRFVARSMLKGLKKLDDNFSGKQ
jgi:hypothetical protein